MVKAEIEGLAVVGARKESAPPAKAGIQFLEYMKTTWLPVELWKSWSRYGREEASRRLRIPVQGVLPTTNHLESFNAVLKRKHIRQWQRSGHRLRFDVFIHHLIVRILPHIFAKRRLRSQLKDWVSERFRQAAGGVDLVRQTRRPLAQTSPTFVPLCWFEADDTRDHRAQDIVALHRIQSIPSGRAFEMWPTCAKGSANMDDAGYPRYWLTMHVTGSGTCTCPDWLKQGGACKHLRAFRLLIQHWMSTREISDHFHFATTRDKAQGIVDRNRLWYGPHYEASVTSPLLGETPNSPAAAVPSTMVTAGSDASLGPPGSDSAVNLLQDHAVFQWKADDITIMDPSGPPPPSVDRIDSEAGISSDASEEETEDPPAVRVKCWLCHEYTCLVYTTEHGSRGGHAACCCDTGAAECRSRYCSPLAADVRPRKYAKRTDNFVEFEYQ